MCVCVLWKVWEHREKPRQAGQRHRHPNRWRRSRSRPLPFLRVSPRVLAAPSYCVEVRHLFYCALHWVNWWKAGRPSRRGISSCSSTKSLLLLFVKAPERSQHIQLLPRHTRTYMFVRREKKKGALWRVLKLGALGGPPSCSASALWPCRPKPPHRPTQRALCPAGWQAKCLWNVSAACFWARVCVCVCAR